MTTVEAFKEALQEVLNYQDENPVFGDLFDSLTGTTDDEAERIMQAMSESKLIPPVRLLMEIDHHLGLQMGQMGTAFMVAYMLGVSTGRHLTPSAPELPPLDGDEFDRLMMDLASLPTAQGHH